ncbi:MAG: EscU/YscU/HrcU family type III secretion system export apparatus switch protein [Pirellulaceae bacterium]|nr:EscU/YscU/HrcU family type III secretion system export apparatus switch protein [Pirellulaceae bacterium]
MAESAGEKKHDATPYRRQKAREQGQFARSQDLASSLLLLVAVTLLWWWGPNIAHSLTEIIRAGLTQDRYWDFSQRSAAGFIGQSLLQTLASLGPLLFGICLVIVLTSWGQSGIVFLPEKIAFNLNHINPLKGIKRLFDLPNAVRVSFGVAKILMVASVIAVGLWGKWDTIQGAHTLTVGEIGTLVWGTLLDLCLRVAMLLFLLALFDYGFQWWRHTQDLRMTDEEMREEIKMMNGDPQLIARRRAVQRQLVINRMQSAVPGADVVVTNPTELAIAIKFDAETMPAPIVVAKGAGHVAARIRKMALDHGVPVIERKPLAQALFKHVEIGAMIPSEQYAAVAEVLRYVYQLKGKKLPVAG